MESQVLVEFFKGMASGQYYDGMSHQLYYDQDDGSFFEHTEASSNSWLQRSDGSLHRIYTVAGYHDLPDSDLYKEGNDISDYGYEEFIAEIEAKIAELAK